MAIFFQIERSDVRFQARAGRGPAFLIGSQTRYLKADPIAGLLATGRGAKLAKAIRARPEFGGLTWNRAAAAFS